MIMSFLRFLSFIILQCDLWNLINGAPSIESKSWPPMKTYDIWGPKESEKYINANKYDKILTGNEFKVNNFNQLDNNNFNQTLNYRQNKVLNFFPVPVDDECLSDDGRRSGICLNVYECRIQGGTARGQCALGFGVCCVFTATCDQEVANNITYFQSPNFPGFMQSNMTTCRLKIKMISPDISQLRIDFNHFSMGQPNRSTGICDGDIFSLSGGLDGIFTLCGQNSGQHVYYDVGSRKTSRQATATSISNDGSFIGTITPQPLPLVVTNPLNSNATVDTTLVSTTGSSNSESSNNINDSDSNDEDIEILMNFTSRIFTTRLWEIRITQIPFSQRAPAGCLQYFTGLQGIIQTFNFADNGRHLANQDYRACVRQEIEMCSIAYEPCDDQSFRIGSTTSNTNNVNDGSLNMDEGLGDGGAGGGTSDLGILNENLPGLSGVSPSMDITNSGNPLENPLADSGVGSEPSVPQADASEPATVSEVPPNDISQPPAADQPVADDPDLVEGSGGGDIPASDVGVSTPAVSGGFDIFSFFRNTIFDFRRRSGRQYFSTCQDRITMPCVVEDFIGTGAGSLPKCEPIHCGSKFCSKDTVPCRVESTVTPFGIGVHFGDGNGKGSPEDNIGACLRYSQMPCI